MGAHGERGLPRLVADHRSPTPGACSHRVHPPLQLRAAPPRTPSRDARANRQSAKSGRDRSAKNDPATGPSWWSCPRVLRRCGVTIELLHPTGFSGTELSRSIRAAAFPPELAPSVDAATLVPASKSVGSAQSTHGDRGCGVPVGRRDECPQGAQHVGGQGDHATARPHHDTHDGTSGAERHPRLPGERARLGRQAGMDTRRPTGRIMGGDDRTDTRRPVDRRLYGRRAASIALVDQTSAQTTPCRSRRPSGNPLWRRQAESDRGRRAGERVLIGRSERHLPSHPMDRSGVHLSRLARIPWSTSAISSASFSQPTPRPPTGPPMWGW
jgi:hypothetical protein